MKTLLFGALALASLGVHAELKDKLSHFMPLHSDLSVISAGGERSRSAVFTRPGSALTPDFKSVGANVPRFVNGGLLIENGGKSNERGAKNFIPAGVAPFEPAGKSVKGIYKEGAEFQGKFLLKPVKLLIGGKHVFSFYAKGEGMLGLAPELNLRSGKSKRLKTETFQLSPEWKRYFIAFDAGNLTKVADPAVSFSASFDSKKTAVDAPMLEGPCVYFQTMSPTTYIPAGSLREGELLKLPLLKPEQGVEGAFAFEFTPTADGWWQALLSVGGSWTPEVEFSYFVYAPNNRRIAVKFRGKTLVFPVHLEIGKPCFFVLNYGKDGFALWMNGKKAGEIKVPGVPFKNKEVFLGGRNIEIKSNGIFRNFSIFGKTLEDAEIQELGKNPDLTKTLPGREVSRISPFACSPSTRG